MIEADLGAAILTSSPRAAHSVSAAAKLAAVSMILKHMDSATVHPSSQTNPDKLPWFVGFEETVVEVTKVVDFYQIVIDGLGDTKGVDMAVVSRFVHKITRTVDMAWPEPPTN